MLLLAGVGLVAVAGCKTDTASVNRPAMRLADIRESEWTPLIGARPVPAKNGGVGVSGESDKADFGTASGSDLRLVDTARNDLRRRVRDLAEDQIARETVDMRENADARTYERVGELRDSNGREYQELVDKIASETSLRVRDVEMEFQQPCLNLRLKLAAVNARRGMFGGIIDAQALTRAESLKADLAVLEKRRQDKIQAIRDSESDQVSALRKQQQSGIDAETARLQAEADARIADQTKERRDRLSADLSQGASEDLPKADGIARSAAWKIASDRLSVSSRHAADSAESRFDKDLAAARASARKRQEEIRRREIQDRAFMSKR